MTLAPVDTARLEAHSNEWIDLMRPAAELAAQISETEFVPAELRNRTAAVAACILFGAELGIGPMVALAKIAIIKGRPAPSAELGRALALGASHDIWVEESTNTRVVLCGKRRNSNHIFRVQWTMDDARRAGIAGNPAYAKYPRQMLMARASAELVRQAFPEVLGGITLFAEEAVDIDETELPAITPPLRGEAPTKPPATRKRSRASKPPDEPTPPLEAVPDTDEGPTEAQTKLAMAAFNEQNLGDRDDRIRATTAIIGRSIESWNDLTRTEASTVIDTLQKLKAGDIGWTIHSDGTWQILPIDHDELLT